MIKIGMLVDALYNWQTVIAGVLAFAAGFGTAATLISDTILAGSGGNV
jgi:hypothetical protein